MALEKQAFSDQNLETLTLEELTKLLSTVQAKISQRQPVPFPTTPLSGFSTAPQQATPFAINANAPVQSFFPRGTTPGYIRLTTPQASRFKSPLPASGLKRSLLSDLDAVDVADAPVSSASLEATILPAVHEKKKEKEQESELAPQSASDSSSSEKSKTDVDLPQLFSLEHFLPTSESTQKKGRQRQGENDWDIKKYRENLGRTLTQQFVTYLESTQQSLLNEFLSKPEQSHAAAGNLSEEEISIRDRINRFKEIPPALAEYQKKIKALKAEIKVLEAELEAGEYKEKNKLRKKIERKRSELSEERLNRGKKRGELTNCADFIQFNAKDMNAEGSPVFNAKVSAFLLKQLGKEAQFPALKKFLRLDNPTCIPSQDDPTLHWDNPTRIYQDLKHSLKAEPRFDRLPYQAADEFICTMHPGVLFSFVEKVKDNLENVPEQDREAREALLDNIHHVTYFLLLKHFRIPVPEKLEAFIDDFDHLELGELKVSHLFPSSYNNRERLARYIQAGQVNNISTHLGSNINARDENGQTPIYRLFDKEYLPKRDEIIAVLQKSGLVDLTIRDNQGKTIFHHMIENGHENDIEKVLKFRENQHPNLQCLSEDALLIRDDKGDTVLHALLKQENLGDDTIKIFIKLANAYPDKKKLLLATDAKGDTLFTCPVRGKTLLGIFQGRDIQKGDITVLSGLLSLLEDLPLSDRHAILTAKGENGETFHEAVNKKLEELQSCVAMVKTTKVNSSSAEQLATRFKEQVADVTERLMSTRRRESIIDENRKSFGSNLNLASLIEGGEKEEKRKKRKKEKTEKKEEKTERRKSFVEFVVALTPGKAPKEKEIPEAERRFSLGKSPSWTARLEGETAQEEKKHRHRSKKKDSHSENKKTHREKSFALDEEKRKDERKKKKDNKDRMV